MNPLHAHTAFLIMDFQPGIIDRLPDREGQLTKVKEAVEAARSHQIQIIQVLVGFREGFPEANSQNKSFGTIRETKPAYLVNPKPSISLSEGDILVVKRRVSAFSGSDLEVILRSNRIYHLVLAGISTSGVVLSTIREAADKDYQLTILSDLCADFDQEIHTLLMGKIFPRQARVISSGEWVQEIKN